MTRVVGDLTQKRGSVRGVALSEAGVPVRGATVSVTDAATGAAVAVYTDASLSSPSGSVTANANGVYEFWVPDGTYNLSFSGMARMQPAETVQVATGLTPPGGETGRSRVGAASLIQPGTGVGVLHHDDFARSDRQLNGDVALTGITYGTFGSTTLPVISGGVYRCNAARGAGLNCFIVSDFGWRTVTRLRGEGIFYPAVGGALLGTSRVVLNASRHVYDRFDAGCTVTSGSRTVLDPSVKATDYGSGVSAAGNIPGGSCMTNIVPGVSFDLADGTGNPVNATGNFSGTVHVFSPQLSKASVQAWMSQTQYGIFYNDFGSQHNVLGPVNFPTRLAADGVTRYPIEMSIDMANSRVTAVFPQVGRVSATSAEFATRWGNYAGFQLDPTLNDFGDVGFVSLSCSGPTTAALGQQVAYSPVIVDVAQVMTQNDYTVLVGAPTITLPNDGHLYEVTAMLPGAISTASNGYRLAIWKSSGTAQLVQSKHVNVSTGVASSTNNSAGVIFAPQVVGAGQTLTIAGYTTAAAQTLTVKADDPVSGGVYGAFSLSAKRVAWGAGSP